MELLFSVLVDDNSGDHLGEIYKILGLEPRKQHDQHNLIMQLNDKLLQCGVPKTLFSSEREQRIKCTYGHVLKSDKGCHTELQLNVRPDETEVSMQRLIDRQLTYVDGDHCPKCPKDSMRTVLRQTNPSLVGCPDFLAVIVARYDYFSNNIELSSLPELS